MYLSIDKLRAEDISEEEDNGVLGVFAVRGNGDVGVYAANFLPFP